MSYIGTYLAKFFIDTNLPVTEPSPPSEPEGSSEAGPEEAERSDQPLPDHQQPREQDQSPKAT